MNYFIAPRSGEKSYKNFESTIKHGVPLERIAKYLTENEVGILSNEPIIYAWGNREGTSNAWRKMEPGDMVVFYAHRKLVMIGEVYFKKQDPDLALAMWPKDEKGNPWQYTFFIKNLKYISMPIEIFNTAVGYKVNNIIQGFTHLNNERVNKIIDQFGSVNSMFNLFIDQNSEEVPAENDKLYVNVPVEVKPIIKEYIRLNPKIKGESLYKLNSRKKKIDFITRNKNNSVTGSKGEELVLKIEQQKLLDAGKSDLAAKVRRVSIDDDTLGYDILSFDATGDEKYIEVKTTTTISNSVRFYVSSNEYSVGVKQKNYFIYFVENINSESPIITIVQNPIDALKFSIKPDGYIFEAERN